MAGRAHSYRLTPLAERDLEEIWLYSLKNWSREQADSYLGLMFAAFEGLASGLKVGRSVDIRDGYYKYAVGSHIVYYRQADSSLDIIRILIRILHRRMDVERHL